MKSAVKGESLEAWLIEPVHAPQGADIKIDIRILFGVITKIYPPILVPQTLYNSEKWSKNWYILFQFFMYLLVNRFSWNAKYRIWIGANFSRISDAYLKADGGFKNFTKPFEKSQIRDIDIMFTYSYYVIYILSKKRWSRKKDLSKTMFRFFLGSELPWIFHRKKEEFYQLRHYSHCF